MFLTTYSPECKVFLTLELHLDSFVCIFPLSWSLAYKIQLIYQNPMILEVAKSLNCYFFQLILCFLTRDIWRHWPSCRRDLNDDKFGHQDGSVVGDSVVCLYWLCVKPIPHLKKWLSRNFSTDCFSTLCKKKWAMSIIRGTRLIVS